MLLGRVNNTLLPFLNGLNYVKVMGNSGFSGVRVVVVSEINGFTGLGCLISCGSEGIFLGLLFFSVSACGFYVLGGHDLLGFGGSFLQTPPVSPNPNNASPGGGGFPRGHKDPKKTPVKTPPVRESRGSTPGVRRKLKFDSKV
jgi:hypothetical protein